MRKGLVPPGAAPPAEPVTSDRVIIKCPACEKDLGTFLAAQTDAWSTTSSQLIDAGGCRDEGGDWWSGIRVLDGLI